MKIITIIAILILTCGCGNVKKKSEISEEHRLLLISYNNELRADAWTRFNKMREKIPNYVYEHIITPTHTTTGKEVIMYIHDNEENKPTEIILKNHEGSWTSAQTIAIVSLSSQDVILNPYATGTINKATTYTMAGDEKLDDRIPLMLKYIGDGEYRLY